MSNPDNKYRVNFNSHMNPCIFRTINGKTKFIAQFGNCEKDEEINDLLRANICMNALNEVKDQLLGILRPVSLAVDTLKCIKKDIEMAMSGEWDYTSSEEGFTAIIESIDKTLKNFKTS